MGTRYSSTETLRSGDQAHKIIACHGWIASCHEEQGLVGATSESRTSGATWLRRESAFSDRQVEQHNAVRWVRHAAQLAHPSMFNALKQLERACKRPNNTGDEGSAPPCSVMYPHVSHRSFAESLGPGTWQWLFVLHPPRKPRLDMAASIHPGGSGFLSMAPCIT
jgi:hypothetical protein